MKKLKTGKQISLMVEKIIRTGGQRPAPSTVAKDIVNRKAKASQARPAPAVYSFTRPCCQQ